MQMLIEQDQPEINMNKMTRAIYGKLKDIVADIYLQKMNAYRLIMSEKLISLRRVIVFITVVF